MSDENEMTNADETKNVNEYKNMSAAEALTGIKHGKIILPDIQRNFVWGRDDIIKLFESIVAGYPIGSFIFWVTDRLSLIKKKPNLYNFETNLKEGDARNSKIEVFNKDTYYIVLDGQQRLTAMYMAFYGTYKYYKGGKGHLRKYENSWIKNEFCYNLDYYKDKDADEEHPPKMFFFAKKADADSAKCKLDFLLNYDDSSDLEAYMDEQKFDENCRKDFRKIYERLHDSSANSLVHYYCISAGEYDEALNIFVRVNSTGRKLSKSDLMFSTLIKDWKTGKEEIDELLEEMNNDRTGGQIFSFSRDYLMRLCLVLVGADTNLKIESFDDETVNDIKSNWDNIKNAAETMSLILKKLGFYHETLISYNATIPIAYYLYKGGHILDDKDSEKEVRKFLGVCFAKRLFGFSGNAALNKTRDVLKAASDLEKPPSFSLSLFKDVTLTGDRTFNVGVEDIDKWLTYKKGNATFALLSLLYPEMNKNFTYHQDHCHPYSKFDDDLVAELGLTPEQQEDWRSKRDMLPNLQFMEGDENQSKNAEDLKVWASKPGNNVKYCNNDPSFLEFGNFENFFDERRKTMRKAFARIFDVTLPPENIDNPDQQQ